MLVNKLMKNRLVRLLARKGGEDRVLRASAERSCKPEGRGKKSFRFEAGIYMKTKG